MPEMFLYQTLRANRKAGNFIPLPNYIQNGFSENITLREYQIEAFENTITYLENENLRKNKQTHLLYHMATGSGKTVIMVGMILYYYVQGYRNFLFFVNQNNIIEKTKDNFLNPSSNKYLFKEPLEVLGQQVNIKEVENFSVTDPDAINICFTSIQGLHDRMSFPEENGLSIEDFENEKTVLLSDEAHHVNRMTKKPNQDEKEMKRSWEYSVQRIFHANRDNVLLEFTATADLRDPNVKEKYLDKIIFDYPLSNFRRSGFTKDFQNMAFDYNHWERTLVALILSEYRRHKFADLGQNIKPVVLMKSQRISDSEDFYKDFFEKLKGLTTDEIESLRSNNNKYLQDALKYFAEIDESYYGLVETLKTSFAEHTSIIMNGKRDDTPQKQLLVNSLEDKENPYRIIFTVDMLNEGWDVLNLFDIVRLYETRQSGQNRISNYTIREAQLIGRGARYCPFIDGNPEERFVRKYDNDLTNENRILETLFYHSKYDNRYISEINKALKQTGLLPENAVQIEYRLKDEFKNKEVYHSGLVFSNEKIPKSRQSVKKLDDKIRNMSISYEVPSGRGDVYSMFSEEIKRAEKLKKTTELKRMKEIPYNILQFAISEFNLLKFNILKDYFPNLNSTREFLTSDDYLGNIKITIDSPEKDIKPVDKYEAVRKVLIKVANHMSNMKGEFEGTREFKAKPLSKVIYDKTISLTNIAEDGEGVSQSEVDDDDLRIDLNNKEWYVFQDNYGTKEEKSFVKYFSNHIGKLKEKYDEVYLIRNERFPELAIYTFNDGARFEPDFIILLRKKGQIGFVQEQIYVEPKGDHLISDEVWKEEFLLTLEKESIPYKIYADDNEYRIIGLPFYNESYRMKEFSESFDDIIEK